MVLPTSVRKADPSSPLNPVAGTSRVSRPSPFLARRRAFPDEIESAAEIARRASLRLLPCNDTRRCGGLCMKWTLWCAGLVLGCLAVPTAQAGLFDHGGHDCCVPHATCAAPAPHCCVTQPSCAAPAPQHCIAEPVCAAPAPQYCAPQPVCAAPVVDQCCQPNHCCQPERECFLKRCWERLCHLERRKNDCLKRTFLRRGNDECCGDPMAPYYPGYYGGHCQNCQH